MRASRKGADFPPLVFGCDQTRGARTDKFAVDKFAVDEFADISLTPSHLPSMAAHYATASDFDFVLTENAIVRITDDRAQAKVAVVIERAIIDAESLIDSYLRAAGYALPFEFETADDVPSMLRKLTIDIAAYNLYSRTNEEMSAENIRRINHDRAIEFLSKLQKGETSIDLPLATQGETDNAIVYRTGKKMFPDNLERLL